MSDHPAPARRPGELSFEGRRRLFLAGAAVLGGLMLWGLGGLPDFDSFTPLYGQVINHVGVQETSATAAVSAVNFDYRGFDTMGVYVFVTSGPSVSGTSSRCPPETRVNRT